MTPEVMERFGPDRDQLLREIAPHIDNAMIDEIAAADYGQDSNEHRKALLSIRDRGEFPARLRWKPREVLELTRWNEPENPSYPLATRGVRGHWMRAFSCAALLIAGGNPMDEDLRTGWNQTLINLIESLSLLDCKFDREAAALMAWLIRRFDTAEDEEELAFFGVALLWFGLRQRPMVSDVSLEQVADWTLEREARADHVLQGRFSSHWLLETTFFDHCHNGWQRLGSALLALDLAGRSEGMRDRVSFIGLKLAGAE